jgi:hypothetical protein
VCWSVCGVVWCVVQMDDAAGMRGDVVWCSVVESVVWCVWLCVGSVGVWCSCGVIGCCVV